MALMIRYLKTCFCCIFFCALFLMALGQSNDTVPPAGLLIQFDYGFQWPGADLAQRYGLFNRLGTGLEYILPNQNWQFGLNASLLFGTQIKEDVLASIRTAEGFIYSNDKTIADIRLRGRGWYLGATLGKLFPLSKKNVRSGLLIKLGDGLLETNIRIQEATMRFVQQIANEYKKGFDRLSNGLALQQFIGYQSLDIQNRINFYAGIELIQAFTESRRDLQFDLLSKDQNQYFNLLWGVKVGWVIPLYFRKASTIFY